MKIRITKLLGFVLALSLAVTLMPSFSFAAELPFKDVTRDDWFYNDVADSYSMGLINGKTADSFAPYDNLTYGEVAKLAACMDQLNTEGKVTLTNGTPWYKPYVDYCRTNGIVTVEYDWTEQATRAGYMEIFSNALVDTEYSNINKIPDDTIPDVPSFYPGAEAIYRLYRCGVVQGTGSSHCCYPELNIQRSEVAAILNRMMNYDKRVKFETTVPTLGLSVLNDFADTISYTYICSSKSDSWGEDLLPPDEIHQPGTYMLYSLPSSSSGLYDFRFMDVNSYSYEFYSVKITSGSVAYFSVNNDGEAILEVFYSGGVREQFIGSSYLNN